VIALGIGSLTTKHTCRDVLPRLHAVQNRMRAAVTCNAPYNDRLPSERRNSNPPTTATAWANTAPTTPNALLLTFVWSLNSQGQEFPTLSTTATTVPSPFAAAALHDILRFILWFIFRHGFASFQGVEPSSACAVAVCVLPFVHLRLALIAVKIIWVYFQTPKIVECGYIKIRFTQVIAAMIVFMRKIEDSFLALLHVWRFTSIAPNIESGYVPEKVECFPDKIFDFFFVWLFVIVTTVIA